jgi:hypothetical protein
VLGLPHACLLVMFRLILDRRIGTGPLILMQQPCGLVLSHHSLVAAGFEAAGGEAAGGEAAARPGGWGGTVVAFYLDSHLI